MAKEGGRLATSSSNSAGAEDANGNEDAMEYAFSLTPMEGLSVGASYYDPDDSATAQEEEGGAGRSATLEHPQGYEVQIGSCSVQLLGPRQE